MLVGLYNDPFKLGVRDLMEDWKKKYRNVQKKNKRK